MCRHVLLVSRLCTCLSVCSMIVGVHVSIVKNECMESRTCECITEEGPDEEDEEDGWIDGEMDRWRNDASVSASVCRHALLFRRDIFLA